MRGSSQSPVPKPGQMSLRGNCLCPAPLEDLLPDWTACSFLQATCSPAPVVTLIPRLLWSTFLLASCRLSHCRARGEDIFSSTCPTAQVFHGCLCHQHKTLGQPLPSLPSPQSQVSEMPAWLCVQPFVWKTTFPCGGQP